MKGAWKIQQKGRVRCSSLIDLQQFLIQYIRIVQADGARVVVYLPDRNFSCSPQFRVCIIFQSYSGCFKVVGVLHNKIAVLLGQNRDQARGITKASEF